MIHEMWSAEVTALASVKARMRSVGRGRERIVPQLVAGRPRDQSLCPKPRPLRAGVAALVVLIVVLVPLVPRPSALAAGASQRSSTLTPYSGTSVTTWVSTPDLAPRSASRDLGATRITSTWAIQDASHYRIESVVDGPGLDSSHNTVVANGTDLIWYSSMDNRAIRLPASQTGLGMFDLFQGLTALPPGTTLQRYLADFNNKQSGTRARYVGQAQVLGRTADMIDISPVYRVSNKKSRSCNSPKACLKQSHGVGRTRLWLDHQYAVVLRSREFGVPADSGFERHLRYRVTSITFGQGPTPAQLAYAPPGPIVKPPGNSGSSGSSGTTGAGGWELPPPFLGIGSLAGPNGQPYVLDGSGEGGDTMLRGPAVEEALFAAHRGGVTAHKPYVYIEERIRADGVPENLRTGQETQIENCETWSGAYPDGLNRIALARGGVAILLVSNSFSVSDLERYVTQHLCQ